MQILGYRHFEVGGISPWTVVEGGPLDETNPLYRAHQFAYQPVAAYCHDYDRRFFAGEAVKRRVEVFNDVPERSELVLRWTLNGPNVGHVSRRARHDARVVPHGEQRLELGPADHRMLDVVLPMPEVARRTAGRVAGHAAAATGRRSSTRRTSCGSSRGAKRSGWTPLAWACSIPACAMRKALAAAGLAPADVPSLAAVPDTVDVLIVGAGALADRKEPVPVVGRVAPERAGLDKFLARGGRVLVLAQQAYPSGLFDVALSDHRSTMTFAARPGHPALAGVRAEDLKFWRGDHLVTGAEPVRPAGGGAVPIVVSGSAAGLDHAPLMECPAGQGCDRLRPNEAHREARLRAGRRADPAQPAGLPGRLPPADSQDRADGWKAPVPRLPAGPRPAIRRPGRRRARGRPVGLPAVDLPRQSPATRAAWPGSSSRAATCWSTARPRRIWPRWPVHSGPTSLCKPQRAAGFIPAPGDWQ